MPALRIATLWIAAVAALVGCRSESAQNVPPPEVRAEETSATTQTVGAPRHQAFARTLSSMFYPAANARTREFLAWASDQHSLYCGVELDAKGDCVELHIHPCWPTSDEEVEVISNLKHVQSLTLNAMAITDDGLRHLETMPALRTLRVVNASRITDDGLDRLKRAKPDLEIDVPYRKAQQ